jgi:hypothetical protein
MNSLQIVYRLFFSSESERVTENPTVDQYLIYERFMVFCKKLTLIPSMYEKGKEWSKAGFVISIWQEVSKVAVSDVIEILVVCLNIERTAC